MFCFEVTKTTFGITEKRLWVFVCSEIIGQFKKKHRSPYCIFCIMKEEGFFLSTIIFWQWAMAAIVNNTTSNNEKLIQVHNK